MSGMILAVVAHPDDESLIAGGTLALAARAGVRTAVVSLTCGELGPISDPQLSDREHLGEVRAGELEAAAKALGVERAICLKLPDGELPWAEVEFASSVLAQRLRGERPDVLLTFGEDGLYGHPDHAAAAQIARRAVERLTGGATDVYEATWPPEVMLYLVAAVRERGLPDDLWGVEAEAFGCERPVSLSIDVRSVLPQKLAAIRAHRTQIGADHLLADLPLDLAEVHLGREGWSGPEGGRLTKLLGIA